MNNSTDSAFRIPHSALPSSSSPLVVVLEECITARDELWVLLANCAETPPARDIGILQMANNTLKSLLGLPELPGIPGLPEKRAALEKARCKICDDWIKSAAIDAVLLPANPGNGAVVSAAKHFLGLTNAEPVLPAAYGG